jgi:dipeptidyl aminopeptidase/acylaminoacyl peptidase
MDGGEAMAVTRAGNGVQQFSWSPDGSRIAFATEDDAPKVLDDRTGEDGFELGDDDLFTSEAPRPCHIWLVGAEGGEAKRLTSGTWSLPAVLPSSSTASPLAWSPDGKTIAFVNQETPHSGNCDHTKIQLLDVADGSIHPLTGQKAFEAFPSFSPDGKSIAYWWPRDGDPNNQNEVHIVAASGGQGLDLTKPLDRCIYRSIWSADSSSLLVGANDGSQVSLWIQPIQGKAKRLDLGGVSPVWSWWVDVTMTSSGAIAFVGQTASHGPELYVMDTPDTLPRRLTDLNGFMDSLELGRVERVTWRGPAGWDEDGVLTYPTHYRPGTKYPLALVIHGGPNAASVLTFDFINQLLAARGFLVFNPNYRGSDNLGNAYYRAITMDSGEGPGKDVMAGLESLIGKGIVDPGRVVVSGWSWGGYMTTWLLGRYPQRWKAGIAGAAVVDLADEYAFSDLNQQGAYGFLGARPFDGGKGREVYYLQSPLSHVHEIQAPTLIMTMNMDFRVPPTQSYKLFRALKDSGRTVKFIAWPQSGHGPATPARIRQVCRYWVDWLADHVQ